MADLAELERAFIKADDAGNTEDAQAFATEIKRMRQFASTPGGAAVGNPMVARQEPLPDVDSTGEQLSKIGGAGAVGGVMGAFGKEIIGGLQQAAQAYPATGRFGPLAVKAADWLGKTRALTDAAGRVAGATTGAVGGLASEASGQVAEAAGAGPVMAEGFRFAAGGLAPEALNVVKFLGQKVLSAPALSIESKVTKESVKAILAKLQGDSPVLSEQDAALLNKLREGLRGGPVSGQPAADVYGGLQAGAARARAISSEAASGVLDAAEAESKQLFTKAMSGPVQNLREAKERLQTIGQNALATAQSNRLHMAPERELSDIGTDLRGVITKRHERALTARSVERTRLSEVRDQIVTQQEGAGQYIDALPEYRMIVERLKAELKPGKHSPEVADNFRHILNQIQTKAQEAAEAPFGGLGADPFAAAAAGKRPPVTFEMIDDARRQMGQVFEGNAPEGYKAIRADTLRTYYGLLANLQKEFAGGEGGAQDVLQKAYADATEGLQMFGSRLGKKATAVDKFQDDLYATDAATLPKQYFRSREGVGALRELTGDARLVTEKAHEYAVRELAGLTEPQVRNWMTKNRELMASEPTLFRSVAKYADTLKRGEDRAAFAQRGIERVAQKERDTILNVQREGDAVVRNADRSAADIRSLGAEQSKALIGGGRYFKEARIKALIDSKDSSQWDLAADAIKRDPRAAGSFGNAVRQVIAERTSSKASAAEVGRLFEQNIRPAVEQTGLMTRNQTEEIARQIAAIQTMKITEPEKLGLMRRIMLHAVGSYAASAASRAGVNAADAAAKWVPE